MRKVILILVFVLMIIFISKCAKASSTRLHTDGRWIKDENNNTVRLKGAAACWRFIYASQYHDYDPLTYSDEINESSIDLFASTGANFIRLCLNGWTYHVKQAPKYIAAIDTVINWSKARDIKVALSNMVWHDMDNGQLYWTKADEIRELQTWKSFMVSLAQKYKNEPTVIGFDMLNEPAEYPRNDITWDEWRTAVLDVCRAIHAVDSNYLCFVEPLGSSSDTDDMDNFKNNPLSEPNIVYCAHKYMAWNYPYQDYAKSYGDGNFESAKQQMEQKYYEDFLDMLNTGYPAMNMESGVYGHLRENENPNWDVWENDSLALYEKYGVSVSWYPFDPDRDNSSLFSIFNSTGNDFTRVGEIWAEHMKLLDISGKMKDKYNKPIQARILIDSLSNNADVNGNYYLTIPAGLYDLTYEIPNFFIPNFWIKLLSLNLTSDTQNLVNYVTEYPSENKLSFTVNITNNQTIQTYSPEKPKKVLINGTDATEVSSLSELSDNTWFYDSSENKLYMNVNSTNQTMMEKTVTWADGTNETIKVDDKGRIFLNGSKKIAFGLHIVSRDWKKSSPKQVLDTLQSVTNNKIRFMALDLSSWLNISQCQGWMNTWMDELYNHKMFVLLNIQENPTGSLNVDAQAQRFSDIVDLINDNRWANIIFAVGYGGWEQDLSYLNHTNEEVETYLSNLYPRCKNKIENSIVGNVPLITKHSSTISEYGTIQLVKWSDIPNWDFYPSPSPDWKTYIDQRLPVYHEQTMVQAGKSGYQIWLNENGYDSNNTQYPPEMFRYLLNGGDYNDISMILLWCLEWDNDNYEYRAFDTNGNPRQWFLNLVPYLP